MQNTQRTIKDWIIATRPWSFPASVVPVIVISAYLFFLEKTGLNPITGSAESFHFDFVNAILCFFMMVMLHSGGNLVSDYFDHTRGVDKPDGPNGVFWIHSGIFQPAEILRYGWVQLSIGAALGILVLLRSDFSVLWIGVLALLLPAFYPWLKAHALGDLDIFLCFALLPALGLGYVVTGNYHFESLLYCLPFGLLTVSILHANNTRDIDNDRQAGLRTLPHLAGLRRSKTLYFIEVFAPYLIVTVLAVVGFFFSGPANLLILLPLATLPLAVKNVRMMYQTNSSDNKPIAQLDQLSAKVQLAFGLLYALGFVIAALL